MPDNLKPHVEKARARLKRRHANPGVEVAVERVTGAYTLSSPHGDHDAWEAMVFDAIGTRSTATATVFLTQLTELCSKAWHPDEDEGEGGEWYPDADELNMILNVVAGVKPRNEMQAALAAQMAAVHLMTMKASKAALEGWSIMDPRTAATAGKLARTFVMQMDALARAKGKRTTRQTIKVEKHVHQHQHVHVDRGAPGACGQPHGTGRAGESAERPALPREEQVGEVVPLRRDEGQKGLLHARRGKPGRAKG
ncbi:MAG: hypothetical protein ACR2JJ_04605 [Sphingomicrobium sp.]